MYKLTLKSMEACINNTIGFYSRDWKKTPNKMIRDIRGQRALDVTLAMKYLVYELARFTEDPHERFQLDEMAENLGKHWDDTLNELFPPESPE